MDAGVDVRLMGDGEVVEMPAEVRCRERANPDAEWRAGYSPD